MHGGLFYIVAALALSPLARADQAVTVDWSCPQTSTSALPIEATYDVRIDDKATQISSPDLTNLLKAAAAQPGIDYFGCFHMFIERVHSEFASWCETQKPAPPVCATYRTRAELVAQLGDPVAVYAQKAYLAGAVSPFTPAWVSSRKPSKEFSEKRAGIFKKSCSFGGTVRGQELLDRRFIEHELPGLLSKTHCPREILVKQFRDALRDDQLTTEQCAANSVACGERREALRDSMRLLAKAGLSEFAFDPAPYVAEGCTLAESVDRFLFDLALYGQNITKCVKTREPRAGEENKGERAPANIGAQLSARYTIRQLAGEKLSEAYQRLDGTKIPAGTTVPVYEATVNFKFAAKTKEVANNFESLARMCYSREPAKSKLRGPDGELLQIKLFVDNPGVEEPELQTITIPETIMPRSDSKNWSPDVYNADNPELSDCATVLHETFHVLGLPDLYEESEGALVDAQGRLDSSPGASRTDPSYRGKYDCRPKGLSSIDYPEWNSLMQNHSDAFKAMGVGSQDVTYCNIKTSGTNNDRETRRQLLRAKAAKRDFTCMKEGWVSETALFVTPTTLNRKAGDFNGNDSMIIKIAPSVPKRASLLFPAEFRAVTRPGCVSANKLYFSCVHDAYLTSEAHFGADNCSAGLPAVCRDIREWMK